MRRALFLAIPVLTLVGTAPPAHAGMSFYDPGVYVYRASDGSGWAWGVPMHARASADGNQRISCTVRDWVWTGLQGNAYATNVYCAAEDASGVQLYCSAGTYGNTSMSQALAALTPWSLVQFQVDAQGQCQNLYVDNESAFLPATSP